MLFEINPIHITSHSSRTNNSWLFAPSSLILANHYLPLNGALVAPTNKINIYFSVWRISQMFIVCFVLLCGNFTVFKCLAFLAKQFRLNGFGASSLNSL
ncbi:MAG: hypothetical protein ACJA0H_001434 [Francisellaceae bacterium]|jgi:hypothetical protein